MRIVHVYFPFASTNRWLAPSAAAPLIRALRISIWLCKRPGEEHRTRVAASNRNLSVDVFHFSVASKLRHSGSARVAHSACSVMQGGVVSGR